MEELQSTEILDAEILEDARKKAYRILKAADEGVKASAEAWEKKTNIAIAKTKRHYTDRFVSAKDEILARLVLDKRRVRSEKIEYLIRQAMDAYLRGLSHEELFSLLEQELQTRLSELRETGEFPDVPVNVWLNQISKTEAETILARYLPAGWSIQEVSAVVWRDEHFPHIVLDAPLVRVNVSIDSASAALLEDKRSELLTALLGEVYQESVSGDSGGEAPKENEADKGEKA
ncbi:MAG: ATPase [Treponema sp.]|nr:ATPase [Treponema sp.]